MGKLDKAYDSKMAKYLNERDRRSGLEHIKDEDDVVFPGEFVSRYDSKKFLMAIDAKSLARSMTLKAQQRAERAGHASTTSSADSWTQEMAQRFLQDGLDRNHTRSLSRKAKLLNGAIKGPIAGYGMVLEELMKAHGQTFSFPLAKSPTKIDRLTHHSRGHNNSAIAEGELTQDLESPRDNGSIGNQSL